MSDERRRRRQKHLQRRRQRQFVEILRSGQDDTEDIREKRPPETAISRVYNIDENGVGIGENVTVTSISDPGVRYEDTDRGYGTEYASHY